MAPNYVQPGKIVRVTAPSTRVSGDIVLVGAGLIGAALHSATTGDELEMQLDGVWTVPKDTTQAFAAGAPVYWNDSARAMNKSAAYTYAGVALDAPNTAATTMKVILNYPKR